MLFIIIAVIVFVLDRLTKHLVATQMLPGQTIPIIEDFFHLTYIENAGAAFGIFRNRTWFLLAVTVIALLFVIYLAFTLARKNKLMILALGLIMGGALGNMLDRFRTGMVVDFLDFRGIWPYIFNVADIGLVCGVMLLGWRIIMDIKE